MPRKDESMAVLDISKTYLSLIRECQYCLVAHNLDYINSTWKSVKRIISGLSEMMNTVSTTCDEETILSMVKELSPILTEMGDAQCNRDVCRIADLIEGDILPWLSEKLNDTTFLDGYDYFDRNIEALNKAGFTDLAELLTEYGHSDHEEHINCSVNSYGEVVLEYTDETHSCNLTGQLHPFMDAAYFVYDMRESKTISYALAGGCIIYEAIAFMIINIATKVFVLEEDTELLFKIFKYFDLAESILSGRLIFLHKDLLGEVAGFIAKRELLVKSTSLKGKLDKTLKKAYSTYQMIVVSAKEEEYLLFRNFHENIRLKALNVSEITGSFKEKNIFLIAGGPSLGNSIEVLRKRHPESVIICVGTSAKKLLAENIDPDYVIISDPLPAMEKQLNQPFDYDATSLIFLATTYSEAVQNFAGKRYIVFQKDFRLSEETAAEENMPLFET